MKTNVFLSSCLILFTSMCLQAQTTKRGLFLGNSYTNFNNLPALVNSVANPKGDTLIHDSNTPGGYWLEYHATNATSLQKIRQGNWDFVVLQEQSQKPSFPPAQVAAETYPYAEQLNDSIELHNPCGETVFYMTWGRKNGDQANCPGYPPLCTYEGMQDRLRTSYLEMADDNDAICSPVGAVWKYVRDSFPAIELYTADESHPSYAGSYLAACTFYASMFRKSPVGSTFYGSLSAADAQAIQNAAAHVVLDSLSNWYIGDYDPRANFVAVQNGNTMTVDFTNSSTNAVDYIWDFGDGNSSTLENPNHTYAANGIYTVTLIVGDAACANYDTLSQNVTVSVCLPTGVNADFSAVVSGDTVNFTDMSTNGTTYAWDFGDGNNDSSNNPSHVYSDTGTYTVVLVVTDSCGYSDTTQQTITIVAMTTGTQLVINAAPQFKVYPNPAQHHLVIEASATIQGVQLLDALGRMIYVENAITEQKVNLTTATYPRGLYFLRIQTKDGILHSQQIILE